MTPPPRHLLAVLVLLLAPALACAVEPIKLPNPWKVGVRLEYATETVTEQTSPKGREKTRSTDTTIVAVTRADATGALQEWSARDAHVETIAGDPAKGEAMRTAASAFEGFALKVALDADAVVVRIENIDEAAARLGPVMRKVMQASAEASIAAMPAAGREAARAGLPARLDASLAAMTSPTMLDALLGRLPRNYNGFVAAELEPGQWYELEHDAELPAGAGKLPTTLQYALSVHEDDPTDIILEWESKVDPKRGVQAAWDLVEKMTGTKLPPEARKGLPAQIRIEDSGFILVGRDTGVVEMFENIRTVVLGDVTRVERSRMRLLNGDHEHGWTDESAAGAEAEPTDAAPPVEGGG